MTENKRVKLHIKWYNIEKTEGEATLTDNGQPLIETEQINDARLLKNILNDLYDENEELKTENEKYKNMFFEIVETALTNKNCRELYCKGILDIFDNANSLNQAREMIKGRLK